MANAELCRREEIANFKVMQFPHNVANLQMHVPLQRLQDSMPTGLLHLDHRQTTLEQTADALVSQVMPSQVCDTGPPTEPFSSVSHGISADGQDAIIVAG